MREREREENWKIDYFIFQEKKKMESSLSREEKEELVRSTKKVKSVSHAGFGEGHSFDPVSPSHDGG